MIERFLKGWNRFFFHTVDFSIYQRFRIAVGVILLIYMLVLGPNWLRWFSDDGVLDKMSARQSIDLDAWSIFYWLPGSPDILRAIYGLIFLQIILLIVGWKPKVQTVSLFIWFVSMHHRNQLIWEGGDVLLRIILFLMVFMPLSGRAANRSVWPLRLLQLQQSILYFSSVGRKLSGDDWLNGNALYYVSRLDEFTGRLFGHPIPLQYMWISRIGCWVTLAVEMLMIFAVWVPSMRRPAVFIGIGFHFILELSMNLFAFQWLMILILLTHLVTPVVREKSK